LWDAMDAAALALIQRLAATPANVEYFYNNTWNAIPPSPAIMQQQMRDGLGTTHHEAGTLWMGTSQADSVTNLQGRFHHVANAFAVGPSVFPTLGSANPSLTALALARQTADAIVASA
jgi:choline dehydrogenase-like flavoprotein